MSDTHDDDAVTATELLLEDALAGDPDALATVLADNALARRFEVLATDRAAMRAAAPAVPAFVLEGHIGSALAAFDELHEQSEATPPTSEVARVVPIERARRRGWLAGAAAAAVGVIAVGGALSLGGSDGSLTADGDSAESVSDSDGRRRCHRGGRHGSCGRGTPRCLGRASSHDGRIRTVAGRRCRR